MRLSCREREQAREKGRGSGLGFERRGNQREKKERSGLALIFLTKQG
jgi:hypothetical protein